MTEEEEKGAKAWARYAFIKDKAPKIFAAFCAGSDDDFESREEAIETSIEAAGELYDKIDGILY